MNFWSVELDNTKSNAATVISAWTILYFNGIIFFSKNMNEFAIDFNNIII